MNRGLARGSTGLVTVRPQLTPVAYTPVVTWAGNTITTQSGFYLKVPGELHVWASFVESAGTASATITITIPTGYTAITMAGSLATGAGFLGNNAAGSAAYMTAAAGATTQIVSQSVTTAVVGTYFGMFIIPTLT